jgi:glycolate oxidase FAD binding subunit
VAVSAAAAPQDPAELAATLAGAAADGRAVRIVGGGSKLAWGESSQPPSLRLSTERLAAILAHNAGDLTVSVQGGVRFDQLQHSLACAGQRLALDPPLPATLGGVLATGDAGPLRHRYGSPRDLVLGMTVALSDGTLAKSGGTVIKNVAGYDLAKLFTGSFGTLGVIVSANLRLHPLPEHTVTVVGSASDPRRLTAAALRLAGLPLELEALDVAWRGSRGGLLAQVAGVEAGRRAQRIESLMHELGLAAVESVSQDASLWERQRAGQRSRRGALVRLSGAPSSLEAMLLAAVSCDGTLVGRAAFGTSWIDLDPEALPALRAGLPPGIRAVLLERPGGLPCREPWSRAEAGALALMLAVKGRFDPAGICNPGIAVAAI